MAFCIRNHSLLDDFASKVLDAQQQNSIRKSYEQITILGSDCFDVRLNGLINFFSSQNTVISVILESQYPPLYSLQNSIRSLKEGKKSLGALPP